MRGRALLAGQLLASVDRHPASFYVEFLCPGPLVGSEFSRPRHCGGSYSTPGETPNPAGGLYLLPDPCRWRWWPCCVGGRRLAAFSRSPSLLLAYGSIHLQPRRLAGPGAALGSLGLLLVWRWNRTLARASGKRPVFRCCCCLPRLRPPGGSDRPGGARCKVRLDEFCWQVGKNSSNNFRIKRLDGGPADDSGRAPWLGIGPGKRLQPDATLTNSPSQCPQRPIPFPWNWPSRGACGACSPDLACSGAVSAAGLSQFGRSPAGLACRRFGALGRANTSPRGAGPHRHESFSAGSSTDRLALPGHPGRPVPAPVPDDRNH